MYPFDIKYNFVMLSQYFIPFKIVLHTAGGKKKDLYSHYEFNSSFLQFRVILMNSGTSQYNAEFCFHEIKKHLGFNFACPLTIFYFKSLKRTNTSLYTASIHVKYKPYSQYN